MLEHAEFWENNQRRVFDNKVKIKLDVFMNSHNQPQIDSKIILKGMTRQQDSIIP